MAEVTLVGSPHRMVTAVALAVEVLEEAVVNPQEMVPVEGEVLVNRTILPPARVMGTPTFAIIVFKILFGEWMLLTSEKSGMSSNQYSWEPSSLPRKHMKLLY